MKIVALNMLLAAEPNLSYTTCAVYICDIKECRMCTAW